MGNIIGQVLVGQHQSSLLKKQLESGNTTLKETAQFGRTYSMGSVVIGNIFGFLFVGIGVYLLFLKSENVIGKIIAINDTDDKCISSAPNMYACSLLIEYTYKGNTYSQPLSYNGPVLYTKGQSITISVSKENPLSITLTPSAPKWVPFLCIVFGLLSIGGSWYQYWLTTKSDLYASGVAFGGSISAATKF